MDAGSRSGEIAARAEIPWTRAALTWMAIMLVETVLGAGREIFIAPVIGAHRASQIGVLVGSAIVLLITWLCFRWLKADTRKAQVSVGAFWVVLTVVFELSLGRAMNLSWSRLFSDYNLAQGGFMLLGLGVMFFAPLLVSAWKR